MTLALTWGLSRTAGAAPSRIYVMRAGAVHERIAPQRPMSGRERLSIKQHDAATDLFRAALLACALPPWRRPITTVVSGLNLAVGGGMAYVATGHERKVLRFDLSNPASPAHVLANTWRDAYGLALAVGDRRLYVAENTGHRVRLITFEPPAVPTGVKASVLNGRAIVEWRHDGAKTTGFTAAYTANGVPSLLCHAPAGERASAAAPSTGWRAARATRSGCWRATAPT